MNRAFTQTVFPSLKFICLFITSIFLSQAFGQKVEKFTHQDSLRGSLTPERTWWNVMKYDITVQPDFNSKTIKGKNTIYFDVIGQGDLMQIDLQEPMVIDSAVFEGKAIPYKRNGNIYLLNFKDKSLKGTKSPVTVYYSGKPREAVRPPWDGGWIWKKDDQGRPWMSVACQGLGASVWFPCKDHQSDEPDNGALLTMIIPDTLVAVANGKMIDSKSIGNGLTATTWGVTNPINSYNIIPYIGKYVHWGETFLGEKGDLSCDYWVLDYELEKAKIQFTQVPKMLKCFEYWFGPYPFYEDGYKLVQSPHLGMEHQSAVAYGNKFQNGYLGTDLSNSGWGLKWDFIIIHESGHEWFGNNITTKDIADMWVHEGFTNYSEAIYTDCQYGVYAGNEYEIGLRKSITNDKPIIGQYNVNNEGSGDMYYKGSSMIHIIRQLMNDDENFRQLLRGLNSTFWHQTVTTKQIEDYIIQKAEMNLSKIFDQYLRTTDIPVLEYKIIDGKVSIRWTNCVEGFDMKVRLKDGQWIRPTMEWSIPDITFSAEEVLNVDPNFYVKVKKIK